MCGQITRSSNLQHDIHGVCGTGDLDPVGGAVGSHDAPHQLGTSGDAERHGDTRSVELEGWK